MNTGIGSVRVNIRQGRQVNIRQGNIRQGNIRQGNINQGKIIQCRQGNIREDRQGNIRPVTLNSWDRLDRVNRVDSVFDGSFSNWKFKTVNFI